MIPKRIVIKVNALFISYNLENEDIDSENDNLDVFVKTEGGYLYTLSLVTPKYFQFLMDTKKINYCNLA